LDAVKEFEELQSLPVNVDFKSGWTQLWKPVWTHLPEVEKACQELL